MTSLLSLIVLAQAGPTTIGQDTHFTGWFIVLALGGVAGAAVAFHKADEGWKKASALEKAFLEYKLAAQTELASTREAALQQSLKLQEEFHKLDLRTAVLESEQENAARLLNATTTEIRSAVKDMHDKVNRITSALTNIQGDIRVMRKLAKHTDGDHPAPEEES